MDSNIKLFPRLGQNSFALVAKDSTANGLAAVPFFQIWMQCSRNSQLIGQMLTVGVGEVEGGDAAALRVVVLEASVRRAESFLI